MRFRPSPLVTVLLAACVLVQLRLSWWQYDRHVRQDERLAMVQERLKNAPAAGLADTTPWRRAILDGVYEEPSAFVSGRFEFGKPGLDLVNVFRTTDGERLLVNRGWIPLDRWQDRDSLAPLGPARVEGLLLPADDSMLPTGCAGTARSQYLPASDTLPARWAGPNWPGILQSAPPGTLPLVLIAGPELVRNTDKSEATLPAIGYIARPHHIGHLEYAGQWFLIAMVFTGGWIYSGIRRGES